MFNKIKVRLNGHAAEVDALTAELDQVGSNIEATKREIAELKGRRHQALLDDAADSTLDKIERELERAGTRLEKLHLAQPGLRLLLTAATDAAGERGIDAALKAIDAQFAETEPLLLELERRMARLFEIRAAAVSQYGGKALIAIPEFGLQVILGTGDTVSAGHVARWVADRRHELDGSRSERMKKAITTRQSRVTAAPAETRPQAAPETLQHRVVLAGGIEQRDHFEHRPAAQQRPRDDDQPLQSGETRVRVLRSGYSPSDATPQCARDQIIRMPKHVAEHAEAAGVIQIIERLAPGVDAAIGDPMAATTKASATDVLGAIK